MSCILRVSGENFDVDHFIASIPIPVDSLWRKGERRYQNGTQINGSSGIRIMASEADFSELQRQIEDVILFLQVNLENLKRLSSFPGVEHMLLDFGAEIHPPGWSSFTFPPELLFLSGQAGISLCLSVYPTECKSETDA
jgi:hypothetical protein